MKVKRFEFGDVGIFHAMDILEECEMEFSDQEDLEWAQRQFEEFLFCPRPSEPWIFYFTEEGLEKFKEPLETILNLFKNAAEEAGLGTLNETEVDIPNTLICYNDRYQVAGVEF